MKINNNKIKSLFLLSLVGSGLTKEEKSNNQTGIADNGVSLNSLPQLATNLTDTKIADESPERNVYAAGTPALFSVRSINGVVGNKCTGGFAVVNTNSSECGYGNDYGGFLTSFFCFPSQPGTGMPVTS
jgi:hypothetical protein